MSDLEWEDNEEDDEGVVEEQTVDNIFLAKKLCNETGRFISLTTEYGDQIDGIIESIVGNSVFMRGPSDEKMFCRIPFIISYVIDSPPSLDGKEEGKNT